MGYAQALLYESARLLHARPHRFGGEEYANVFVHYMPATWGAAARRLPTLRIGLQLD